jgi:hypothetical protein
MSRIVRESDRFLKDIREPPLFETPTPQQHLLRQGIERGGSCDRGVYPPPSSRASVVRVPGKPGPSVRVRKGGAERAWARNRCACSIDIVARFNVYSRQACPRCKRHHRFWGHLNTSQRIKPTEDIESPEYLSLFKGRFTPRSAVFQISSHCRLHLVAWPTLLSLPHLWKLTTERPLWNCTERGQS